MKKNSFLIAFHWFRMHTTYIIVNLGFELHLWRAAFWWLELTVRLGVECWSGGGWQVSDRIWGRKGWMTSKVFGYTPYGGRTIQTRGFVLDRSPTTTFACTPLIESIFNRTKLEAGSLLIGCPCCTPTPNRVKDT